MNSYRSNIAASDLCDGCMNGCSLHQPGCQRGMDKAKGLSSSYRSLQDAQNAYLQRQEEMKQNLQLLKGEIADLFAGFEENKVDPRCALDPSLAGMRIFDEPLLGISNVFDPLFRELKKPDIIGPWHKLPGDWLPGAKRVIAVFFPYSERVREKQRHESERTTPEWLHGRIEGNTAMLAFTGRLAERIRNAGFRAVIPVTDPDFAVVMNGNGISGYPEIDERTFGSKWSERHVAYISGLGTFSLSKGLITERGMAGRICSIVTDLLLPVTERAYHSIDEWCIYCGKCVERCPVNAISLQTGKNHIPCGERINQTKITYAPRYGCGQCQTGVPCEYERPEREKGIEPRASNPPPLSRGDVGGGSGDA